MERAHGLVVDLLRYGSTRRVLRSETDERIAQLNRGRVIVLDDDVEIDDSPRLLAEMRASLRKLNPCGGFTPTSASSCATRSHASRRPTSSSSSENCAETSARSGSSARTFYVASGAEQTGYELTTPTLM